MRCPVGYRQPAGSEGFAPGDEVLNSTEAKVIFIYEWQGWTSVLIAVPVPAVTRYEHFLLRKSLAWCRAGDAEAMPN